MSTSPFLQSYNSPSVCPASVVLSHLYCLGDRRVQGRGDFEEQLRSLPSLLPCSMVTLSFLLAKYTGHLNSFIEFLG